MDKKPQEAKTIGQFIFGDTLILLFADDVDLTPDEAKNIKITICKYGEDSFLVGEDAFALPGLDDAHLIYILEDVIRRGDLDMNRLNDHDYLWSKVKENIDVIDDMGIIAEPHSDFYEAAKLALDNKKSEAAIVLIATAIEQRLNVFYRYALGTKETLSREDVTEVIRNTTLAAKTGWLMSLVSERNINDKLRNRIMALAELRNQIVHFKAVPSDNFENKTGGSHNVIKQRVQNLDFNDLLALPNDLSKELDGILEFIWSQSPDYTFAKQIAESLVEKVQQGQPVRGSFILRSLNEALVS